MAWSTGSAGSYPDSTRESRLGADSIDPATRSGWSVQVQGRSVIPRGLRIDTDCGWPAAAQVVEIEPGRISGHRIHLCPFIDVLLARRPVPTA